MNLVEKTRNMTVCELVDKLKSLTNDEVQFEMLTEIQIKATKMEDRLLKYCNAIEDLGFVRVGRNYNNI